MKKKWIHILVGLLFLSFALVQINDPDPLLWVLVYSLVSICGFLAIVNVNGRWIALLGIVVGLVGIIVLIPKIIDWVQMGMPSIVSEMKTDQPHIEFTREFFGYLLVGITSVLYYRFFKRKFNAAS